MTKIKKFLFIAALGTMLLSSPVQAQEGFYWNFRTSSNHLWTEMLFILPNYIWVYSDRESYPPLNTSCEIDVFTIKDRGKQINDLDDFITVGFSSKDLLKHLNLGLEFGYQSTLFPIGIGVILGYDIRNVNMEEPGVYTNSKILNHRVQSFEFGLNTRLNIPMGDNAGWSPLFELGGLYVNNFHYHGSYDIDCVNNGMKYIIAAGATVEKVWEDINMDILVGCTLFGYNYFNTDYTQNNGLYYPFANVTTSRLSSIFLKIRWKI